MSFCGSPPLCGFDESGRTVDPLDSLIKGFETPIAFVFPVPKVPKVPFFVAPVSSAATFGFAPMPDIIAELFPVETSDTYITGDAAAVVRPFVDAFDGLGAVG